MDESDPLSNTMSFKPYSKSKRKKQKVSESPKKADDKKKSFYHTAHGALSTILVSGIPNPSTVGYYETHFINGENNDTDVAPITLDKDVTGIKAKVTFKIN